MNISLEAKGKETKRQLRNESERVGKRPLRIGRVKVLCIVYLKDFFLTWNLKKFFLYLLACINYAYLMMERVNSRYTVRTHVNITIYPHITTKILYMLVRVSVLFPHMLVACTEQTDPFTSTPSILLSA
jgi:hypothetical protein